MRPPCPWEIPGAGPYAVLERLLDQQVGACPSCGCNRQQDASADGPWPVLQDVPDRPRDLTRYVVQSPSPPQRGCCNSGDLDAIGDGAKDALPPVEDVPVYELRLLCSICCKGATRVVPLRRYRSWPPLGQGEHSFQGDNNAQGSGRH